MYTFNKSIKSIVRHVRESAKDFDAHAQIGEQREILYTMFNTDSNECGTLIFRFNMNEYGMGTTVNAQLTSDLGSANQIGINQPLDAYSIAYAIGFTCATAFWRGPYKNTR